MKFRVVYRHPNLTDRGWNYYENFNPWGSDFEECLNRIKFLMDRRYKGWRYGIKEMDTGNIMPAELLDLQ